MGTVVQCSTPPRRLTGSYPDTHTHSLSATGSGCCCFWGNGSSQGRRGRTAWCVAETRNTQTRPVEVVGGLKTSEPYPTISMLHSLVAAGSLFPAAHAATVTVSVRMESTQDHKICVNMCVCIQQAAERLAGRSNRDERSTSQFLRANSPIMTQQSRKPTAQPSESCAPSSLVSL